MVLQMNNLYFSNVVICCYTLLRIAYSKLYRKGTVFSKTLRVNRRATDKVDK